MTQTLDAVLHKGQTMPEKNRFPAVLQPVGYTNKGHYGAMSETNVGDPLRAKGGDTGYGGETLVCAVSGDITHALNTANNGKGCSEDGTGRGVPTIAFNARQDPDTWAERTGPLDTDGTTQGIQQGLAVRRLTPVECERLQGFPDNHAQVTYRKKPAADGPRYKAIGNSMAVPVMRWVGARIDAVTKIGNGLDFELDLEIDFDLDDFDLEFGT